MPRHIGRYEILGELGRGGFGHVYRARDPQVNRSVAVKTLASDGDPGMLTRFRNEAASTGRLDHRNIVIIHDFGDHEGTPYIVMELLDGRNLKQVIGGSTPMPLLQKVRTMAQIAAGLQHAHSHGIIHRDVKPANIMVLRDREGTAKIMDFGIALMTQAAHSRITQDGEMIGTFGYMAPEQFQNARPDARSDIFAYGVIFYELLCGVHPFHAADVRALTYNIMNVEPVPIAELAPDCPAELGSVIARLLSKDPETRYQNLDDLLFDIEPSLEVLRKKRARELLAEAQTAKAAEQFDVALDLVRQSRDLLPGDEALRQLHESIQIALREKVARPKIDELIRRGKESIAAGKWADAIPLFESAIRMADVPEVVLLLEKARLHAERARDAERLVSEAETAYKRGDPARAAGKARQALALVPEDPAALRVLADCETTLAEERDRTRLAEALTRTKRLRDIRSWEEASKLIARIQSEFPGTPEVEALVEEIRSGWAKEERERLLAAGLSNARQQVQRNDLIGALGTLEPLAAEYPEAADIELMLGFVRVELETQSRREFIDRSIADAKAAAGEREYEKAVQRLDAALAKYPADSDLQNQRRAIAAEQFEAARRTAAEKVVVEASTLRAEGRFGEALPLLEGFLETYGDDTAITNLRQSILKEKESARRAAELREFVHRARDLMAKDRPEDATEMLRDPPSHLKNHSEVTKLLSAAQKQVQARERGAALEETLVKTVMFREGEQFGEALDALDAFENRYGDDSKIRDAREKLKQGERDKAKRVLIAESTALLARNDPSGATALFAQAPGYIREQPEVQKLEKAAARALEEHNARERAWKAIGIAERLRSQGQHAAALKSLEEHTAAQGAAPEISVLHDAILKEQEAARIAEERDRREKAVNDAITRAAAARKQENPAEALQLLDDFLWTQGPDEAVAEMRAAIVREAEHKQREKAANALAAKAGALISSDPAAVVALVKGAPEELRQRPEIKNLETDALRALEELRIREERARLKQEAIQKIGTLLDRQKYREAEEALNPLLAAYPNDSSLLQLRANAARGAALQDALSKAAALGAKKQFGEGLQVLELFQSRYGDDPKIDAAREKLKQGEREKAKRELIAESTALLEKDDPAGATALFARIPTEIREEPEVQNLERAAGRALEQRKAREAAAAQAIDAAGKLRSEARFDAALQPLEEYLKAYGAAPDISALRESILKEQDAARTAEQRRLRENAAKEAMAAATAARKQERFAEALQAVDDFLRAQGPDAMVSELRAAIEREAEIKQREKATKELAAKASALIPSDPAAVVALIASAPAEIRQSGEIRSLEASAIRAVEELRIREKRARLRRETIQKSRTLFEKLKYREASEVLSPLLASEPNDSDLLKLSADIEAGLRRSVLQESERLSERGDFDGARAILRAIPNGGPKFDAALQRVELLQTRALEKRAAEAILASADLRPRDPRRALSILEDLPGALRSRTDVENAVNECRAAIAKAELTETVAAIQSLCVNGKFRKARARHQEAVARFGANSELDQIGAEIQSGLASKPSLAKPMAIAAGALVVVVASAWLYTHRAPAGAEPAQVEIRTDPEGASIAVGGQVCQTPNCKLDLPSGTYALHAQLNGYESADRTLQVGPGQHQMGFDVTLNPITVRPRAGSSTGTLVVETKSPDAMVYVDRAPLRRTDAAGKLSVAIEAGNHTIYVEKRGYQTSAEKKALIAENRSQTVVFNLIPQNAVLELRGAPVGAEVRANGTLIGRAEGPLLLMTIPPGVQNLRITEGVSSKDLSQTFEPGQTVTLEWANVAPPGLAKSAIAASPSAAPKADPAEVEWDAIRSSADPAAVQSYIDKYPGSRHIAEAQARLEALAWGRLDQNNLRALRDYLVRFRGGAHENDARVRVSELVWNSADQKDEQALRTFIQQNSDNPHRAQAQALIDELERQKVEAENRIRSNAKQQDDAKKQNDLQASHAEIQTALRRVNSILSGDMSDRQREREIKTVWPNPPQTILTALTVAHAKMSLDNPQSYVVDGNSATVICDWVLKAPQKNEIVRVKVTLQKSAGGWTVQSFKAN